jgi:hypothetical protein
MKRALSLLVAVVAGPLVCVACGGATKPPTSGDGVASASASTTPADTSTASATPSATTSTATSTSTAPAASSAPVVSADPCADLSAPFEAKVRPDVKKCFFDAMAKRPDLDGHVHITVAIGTNGKAGNILIANDKILGKETVTCMTNAVKAGAFDGVACAGKSVVMNMAFGNAARGN